MFLLVAGNTAELQSLERHFQQAGVSAAQTLGKTYAEVKTMPPDDVPDHPVIVIGMSTSVEGWQSIAERLKGFAPQSYLTCAFLGNPPAEHVGALTRKAEVVGGSLMIITESHPDRTRDTIQELRQRVASPAPT